MPEVVGSLVAIFIFGFIGSLHCAAMCSPLAAAACQKEGFAENLWLFWSYHSARVISYTMLGFVVGLISAVALKQISILQVFHSRYLGLIVGVWFVCYAGLEFFRSLNAYLKNTRYETIFIKGPSSKIAQNFIRKFLNRVSQIPILNSIVLGVVTALLPCGFLYAALAQSAIIANPVYSALAMFIFAVATIPSLSLGVIVFTWLRRRFPKSQHLLSSGVLLIAAIAIFSRSFVHHVHDHHPSDDQNEQHHHQHHHPN